MVANVQDGARRSDGMLQRVLAAVQLLQGDLAEWLCGALRTFIEHYRSVGLKMLDLAGTGLCHVWTLLQTSESTINSKCVSAFIVSVWSLHHEHLS